jgi:hypothetical protein
LAKNINKSTAEALNQGEFVNLSDFGKKLHEVCRLFVWPIYQRHEVAWEFYRGDQWRSYRRSGLAMPTFNIVGPHIDIIASNLTDSQIVFQVAPKNKEDGAMTKIHSEVLRLACEQDSLQVKLYGHIVDALVKGYSIAKVTHAPERLVPSRIEFIDPYNYMGEPGVKRPDIDGTYHWHSEWMTAMQVRELYPKKWRDVKYRDTTNTYELGSDEVYIEREGDYSYAYMTRIHELYIKTNETEKIPENDTLQELQGEREEFERLKAPRVVLEQDHQAHIDDHKAHYEEVVLQLTQSASIEGQKRGMPPEQIQQGLQQAIETNPILQFITKHNEEHVEYQIDNPKGLREKYNGWRRIVFGGDDFFVLEEGSTPYTDEEGRGIHPFIIMTSPETGTDIYQWSVLERCMDLQEMLNLWLGKFQDFISLCSCPMLGLNVNMIEIDPNQITAMAGSMIPINGNPRDAMYWVQPPQISGELIKNSFQMMKQIELITGVSEVELGAFPPMERASEPMLRQLKEAGRARWRQYQREENDFLRRLAHKLLLVIQGNMTEQTQLRIGTTEDSFVIVNQEVQGRPNRLNDMTVGAFDVRIDLQPLQSLTSDAKLQRAMQLFTMANPQGFAPYDLLAVAEESEDPVMVESVKRQMQMMQQAMEAQREEKQTETAR